MSPSQGQEHPPPAPSALHLHCLGQGSILGEHFGGQGGLFVISALLWCLFGAGKLCVR